MNRRLFDLTIVVPTYNGEKYILETLESITKQDVLPAEVIIVDDGSKDRTLELASSADELGLNTQIIRMLTNSGGPAGPINVGIGRARSKWIYVLDQDDLMSDRSVRTLAAISTRYPNIEVIGGKVERFVDRSSNFDVPERVLSYWPDDFPVSNEDIWILPRGSICFLFEKGMVLNGFPGFYFTKAAWKNVGMLDESFRLAADFDFLLRLTTNYSIYISKEVIYKYRFHGSSVTRNRSLLLLEDLRAKLGNYLKATGTLQAQMQPYVLQSAHKAYYWSREARKYEISSESIQAMSILGESFLTRFRLYVFLHLHSMISHLPTRKNLG